MLLCQLFHSTITGMHLSVAKLSILGFFFAMRSYDCVKKKKGESKTQLIRLQKHRVLGITAWKDRFEQTWDLPVPFSVPNLRRPKEWRQNGQKNTRIHRKPSPLSSIISFRLGSKHPDPYGGNIDTPTCSVMNGVPVRYIKQDTFLKEFRLEVK